VAGGRNARLTAGVFALGWGASLAAQALSGRAAPAALLAGVDAVVLAALVALFLGHRRLWTGLIANLQLLIVVLSLTRLLRPTLSELHYLEAIGAVSALMALVLIAGVAAERRSARDEATWFRPG
jgi:hypothetical protein